MISPAVQYSLFQVAGGLSISALAVQTTDLILHFSDEIKYLWNGRLNLVTILYINVRYLILAFQIVNQVMPMGIIGDPQAFQHSSVVRIVKANSGLVCMIFMKLILLLRAYALYYRSFAGKCFLAGMLFIALTLELTGHAFLVQSLTTITECGQHRTPNTNGLIMVAISETIFHLSVFTMNIKKLAFGKKRTPLMTLLLRQELFMFLAISTILVALLLNAWLNTLDLGFGRACFAWFLAFVSMGGSNLLLSLRKFAVKDHQRRILRHTASAIADETPEQNVESFDDSICLTTFFE
ncbi:hypothetical protein HYPSUDRAFT_79708 [Hypholoma sublateritium FD-334 SS-4]|uniref:DUF6533 domain-containing protein n=1 Tax=Hypholoma sublateritium (strain FD-334 SS-4) TaxID=945553 RepID=A0A0D2KRW9_HYPSF|nr:hypothetical protein HYPSUDRAFT_79708 [Hypholoma sublateritium FD-334 SS-4]